MEPSSSDLRVWKVFVGSPADVPEEREKLKEVVDELNQDEAQLKDVLIQIRDWQEVVPLMGRPQQVILDQLKLEETDLLIIILWHRFGTPPGGIHPRTGEPFLSGTEEEFTLAYNLWREFGRPQISVYRCLRDIDPREDGEQLRCLQAFLRGFSTSGHHQGLVQEYTTLEDFRRKVRHNLVNLLHQVSVRNVPLPPPEGESIRDPIVDPGLEGSSSSTSATWDDIDFELLRAFLKECREEQLSHSLKESETETRWYLSQLGLLSDDAKHLTQAGALLLCRKGRMPEGSFTDTFIFDQRSEPGTPPRFGVRPPLYRVFLAVREYLIGAVLTGAETVGYTPYPVEAIVEALANFLIHRDYEAREEGRIEITDDRIAFINPGCSLIDVNDLARAWHRKESLHPPRSKLRNPGLCRALREARIGQKQGRGLIRIRQALARNLSRKPDGSLGLDFLSDDKENRFSLTIYRKPDDLSPEETRIIELASETEQLQDQIIELNQRNEKLQQATAKSVVEQNVALARTRKTQRYYLVLLVISVTLLVVMGVASIFGRGVVAPALHVELGVTEAPSPHCMADEATWSADLYIHSEGGRPPLIYYWNSREITRTSVSGGEVVFSLQQRNGKPIEGTAFVVSSDGQSGAREIRIEAPTCP